MSFLTGVSVKIFVLSFNCYFYSFFLVLLCGKGRVLIAAKEGCGESGSLLTLFLPGELLILPHLCLLLGQHYCFAQWHCHYLTRVTTWLVGWSWHLFLSFSGKLLGLAALFGLAITVVLVVVLLFCSVIVS